MDKELNTNIGSFLRALKEEFIQKWRNRVEEVLEHSQGQQKAELTNGEFDELFDVYMDDMVKKEFSSSKKFLIELIKRKIAHGFLLSTLELINASFMSTARELFRSVYPDAFDKRTEYLESLSQMILNNEVMLAKHYEQYLHDLNNKLLENTELLQRHNAALIEFIDVATHQLQTPLWSILGFVSKLQRKYYESLDDYGRHCLNRITANVSDMHQLIEDVTTMLLLDQKEMFRRDLYLNELFDQAIQRVHEEVDKQFKCIYKKDDKLFIIKGDPHHLKHLFYQIFKNSAQYTQGKTHGEVNITTRLNDKFHIYIEDNGIGIESRYRELVFKPMERLKEKDVSGSGMGLTFARRIMKGHGGEIVIEDCRKKKGICVHMTFPEQIISMLEENSRKIK
ncbi:MAG: HAMP domain-containing histidine kinase [Spirochaetales bacterium]|nr:HAMP domain-containing histidine kinase [Spirochaetales bacterium]